MTMVYLNARPGMGPLTVTLELDSAVYLYSAQLTQASGPHSAVVPGTKTVSDSTWTGVTFGPPGAPDIAFNVTWEAVDTATPGNLYNATLTVSDATGPLSAGAGSANPTTLPCKIGPATMPTDFGHLGVVIS